MSTSKHILILPANAQGHLIPTIAFAKRLAAYKKDFTITIATTPLNAQFIRSSILADAAADNDSFNLSASLPSHYSNVRVVDFPFNSADHGLLPNIENTDFVPIPQLPRLAQVMRETVSTHFHSLISSIIAEDGQPPLCIISDILYGWVTEIAQRFTIPSFCLIMGCAFSALAILSFWENLPHRRSLIDSSDEYTLPGLPEKYRFKSSDLLPFIREADGDDIWSKGFHANVDPALNADGWLCNTFEEFEGFALELLRKRFNGPVWTVGPFLPSTMLTTNSSSTSSSKIHCQHGLTKYEASPRKCIEWLDLHSQDSVVYISFGSQLTINVFQMMELAKGLEESGHPFLWVIRPPLGFNRDEEFQAEWLPEKFEEKMTKSGQGFIVHGWAPQLEILSHKSTGAFLSHCGWNSVLESLSQGVPIIGWPMADDQPFNLAYLMEEMGVCMKLAGGLTSVIMSKEVSRIIRLIMEKDNRESREMKKKLDAVVEKMRAAVREDDAGGHDKGSSIKALDDFFNVLQKRTK